MGEGTNLGEIDIVKDTPLVEVIAFSNYGVCWKIMGFGIFPSPIWLGRAIVVQFQDVAVVRIVAVSLGTILVCSRGWETSARWEKPEPARLVKQTPMYFLYPMTRSRAMDG